MATIKIYTGKEDTPIEIKNSHDAKLEDIKSTIMKGIDICNNKVELLKQLQEDIEIFSPVGINDNDIFTLEKIINILSITAPKILLGKYEELMNLIPSNLDEEEALAIYKNARKKLINNIGNIDFE